MRMSVTSTWGSARGRAGDRLVVVRADADDAEVVVALDERAHALADDEVVVGQKDRDRRCRRASLMTRPVSTSRAARASEQTLPMRGVLDPPSRAVTTLPARPRAREDGVHATRDLRDLHSRWIPSEAITGTTPVAFDLGVAHYDDPPPDELDDLEALRATTASASPTAWRPRSTCATDGVIPDARYTGGGMIGATTMRSARAPHVPGVLHARPARRARGYGDGWVRFTQTAGGRTGVPDAAQGPPPAVRPVERAARVDDALAHRARRRAASSPGSPARARSRATGSTTTTGVLTPSPGSSTSRLVRPVLREALAVGRPGLRGVRDRRRVRARALAVGDVMRGAARRRSAR